MAHARAGARRELAQPGKQQKQPQRDVFDTEVSREWFGAFFGRTPAVRGILAMALNNGQIAYGTRYYGVSGEREMYAVINALQLDEDGLPVLSAAIGRTQTARTAEPTPAAAAITARGRRSRGELLFESADRGPPSVTPRAA